MSSAQEVTSHTSILISSTTQALHTGTEAMGSGLSHQLSTEETQRREFIPTATCFDVRELPCTQCKKKEKCKKEHSHALKYLLLSRRGKTVGIHPGGRCSVLRRASQHLLKGFLPQVNAL